MRLEPQRVELRHPAPQAFRVDLAEPSVVGHAAATVAVRLDHRAREVLEDAVHHQLDAGRLVSADRGAVASCDELLDLLGASVALPPHRPDHATRQLTPGCERDVRALFRLGTDDRVLPGRDPQRMKVGLPEPQRFFEVGRRVVRDVPFDEVHGAFLEGAARRSVGPSLDPTVTGIGGRGGHAGELEGPAVHPGAVAIAARQEHRSIGQDAVEILTHRRPALERRHVPAAPPDPGFVRIRSRVRGDDLEVLRGHDGFVEIASEQGQATVDRVDMGILEARRHRSAAELDDPR
jgi:hypothetical protein